MFCSADTIFHRPRPDFFNRRLVDSETFLLVFGAIRAVSILMPFAAATVTSICYSLRFPEMSLPTNGATWFPIGLNTLLFFLAEHEEGFISLLLELIPSLLLFPGETET